MAELINALPLPAGAVCLNIGSSTAHFRTKGQPHIDSLLFAPMRKGGIQVIHCDMKQDDGVDLVGDVLEPDFQSTLRKKSAQLIVCSNLLEHLSDPQSFASACANLVEPGGYALFSVPSSYPFHPDPIDTMFRPSPEELARMLPGWEVVGAEELACGNFWKDLRRSGMLWRKLGRHLARLLFPFYRPRFWLSSAHRLLWLFRDYRVALLLVRRPGATAA